MLKRAPNGSLARTRRVCARSVREMQAISENINGLTPLAVPCAAIDSEQVHY